MNTPCPIERILKRDGTLAQYDCDRVENAILKATTSAGRADSALARRMAGRVEEALVRTYRGGTVPTVEDIQDVVESVLMQAGLTDLARKYIIYRHQRAMARAARAYEFEVTDNVPYKTIYEVLRWNMDHRCDSVAALNGLVRSGDFPGLVQDSDRRYQAEVDRAAARILGRQPRVRIVIIAGPSSSGKTTTTIKLGAALQAHGVTLKAINIDHYFFDLVQHPRDEFGDYDYETPEALDLDLINEHLAALLDGRPVKTPHYDFKSGTRALNVHDLALAENELLLIDSLHGLYEGMTRSVPASSRFGLYVETLGQFRGADGNFMRWSDNRLLRRMIRDRDFRNLKPIETLTHWHYVRRSELSYIIPFIKDADCIVNTALPYEMPILRARLLRTVAAVVNRYRDDPRRLDAHIRVNRVHDLLKPIRPVADDGCVPADSLLREFVGGSVYRY